MKIETKKVLNDLAGSPIKKEDGSAFTMGEGLSNILISCETGGKMKLYALATSIYKDKQVEIDEADLVLIKDAVKATKIYNALIAGQIEGMLENIKKDK